MRALDVCLYVAKDSLLMPPHQLKAELFYRGKIVENLFFPLDSLIYIIKYE